MYFVAIASAFKCNKEQCATHEKFGYFALLGNDYKDFAEMRVLEAGEKKFAMHTQHDRVALDFISIRCTQQFLMVAFSFIRSMAIPLEA